MNMFCLKCKHLNVLYKFIQFACTFICTLTSVQHTESHSDFTFRLLNISHWSILIICCILFILFSWHSSWATLHVLLSIVDFVFKVNSRSILYWNIFQERFLSERVSPMVLGARWMCLYTDVCVATVFLSLASRLYLYLYILHILYLLNNHAKLTHTKP